MMIRQLLRALTFLFLCSPAFGQYYPYSGQAIVNSNGLKAGSFAKITIYTTYTVGIPPTCSGIRSIYANATGSGGPIAPPLIADMNGNYTFWTASGSFCIGVQASQAAPIYYYPATAGSGTQGLGNGTTVIDVAASTPYTSDIDLWAATQFAITMCITTCTYDYSGYAGKSMEWSQDPRWPHGSIFKAPQQTWLLPTGASFIPTPWGRMTGENIGSSDEGLIIRKMNTTDDYTPAILITADDIYQTNLSDNFELDHVRTWTAAPALRPATPSGLYTPDMPITSILASTHKDAVTSAFYLSGGTATGTAGQTCVVSGFDMGGSAAAATLTLAGDASFGAGTGFLASGTPMKITSTGSGYTDNPTTAALSDGTAHCFGAINVLSGLGMMVVNGSFPLCTGSPNPCVRRWTGVHGTASNDYMFFTYAASTTQVTLSTPGGHPETPVDYYPHDLHPQLEIYGGFGLSNLPGLIVTQNSLHDATFIGDVGMVWFGSGCNCYNFLDGLQIGGPSGGFFKFGNSYSNKCGFGNFTANDQSTVGYPSAFGIALWESGGGLGIWEHLNIENSKYSIIENSVNGPAFPSVYEENDQVIPAGFNGVVSGVILKGATNLARITAPLDVNTQGLATGYINNFASSLSDTPIYPERYGSDAHSVIPPANAATAGFSICGSGCTTTRHYYAVVRDRNAPDIGSCNVIGCSAPIPFISNDSHDADFANNASLSSTNYDILASPVQALGPDAFQSWDVLEKDATTSNAWKTLGTGITPGITQFKNDGSWPQVAYTPAVRNMTADGNWINSDPSTSGTCQPSPLHTLAGTFWNGSASAPETWTMQILCTAGTNGGSVMAVRNVGTDSGPQGFEIPALAQPAAKTWAGTCSMSSGRTCTFTETAIFRSTPLGFASDQSGVALAGTCALSGTTVTITAASSNSDTWGCMLVGNP